MPESDTETAFYLNRLKPFLQQFGEVSSPVQVSVPGHGGADANHAAQGPAAINRKVKACKSESLN